MLLHYIVVHTMSTSPIILLTQEPHIPSHSLRVALDPLITSAISPSLPWGMQTRDGKQTCLALCNVLSLLPAGANESSVYSLSRDEAMLPSTSIEACIIWMKCDVDATRVADPVWTWDRTKVGGTFTVRGSLIVPANLETQSSTATYVVPHLLMEDLQKATQDRLRNVMEGLSAKGTVAPRHPKDTKIKKCEKLPYKVCLTA